MKQQAVDAHVGRLTMKTKLIYSTKSHKQLPCIKVVKAIGDAKIPQEARSQKLNHFIKCSTEFQMPTRGPIISTKPLALRFSA